MGAVPFGRRGKAHVLVPRSSWSGKPTNKFVVYEEQRSHRCGRRRPSRFGRTRNGFEMSTLPTKQCERECQNSALHNANVDTDRTKANDVWSLPKELRVRSGYGVEVQENSCRKALDLNRQNWFKRPGQRCKRVRGSKDGVDKVGCLSENCSSGVDRKQ